MAGAAGGGSDCRPGWAAAAGSVASVCRPDWPAAAGADPLSAAAGVDCWTCSASDETRDPETPDAEPRPPGPWAAAGPDAIGTVRRDRNNSARTRRNPARRSAAGEWRERRAGGRERPAVSPLPPIEKNPPDAALTRNPETGQAPPVASPDTFRIAKALEDAGMTPEEARVAALRLRPRTRPKPAGYPLDSTSQKLRNELLEAIAGAGKHLDDAEGRIVERFADLDRRHIDVLSRRLDAIEYRLGKRTARLVWKLFAALVAALTALVAAGIAAVLYLP